MSDTPYQPLTGNPDDLKKRATQYQEIGNAIARSVNTLSAIGDDHQMRSKAIDALRDTASAVGEDIDKAKERYASTADALLTYSSALDQAQKDALTAIQHINARQQEADTAHRKLTTANQNVDDASDQDRSDAQKKATNAQTDATSADHALQAAQQEWHDALTAKNNAAKAAIATIVDVVDKNNHGLKDSWWDDWGATVFDIFKKICDWAGILAIFLSWVPILGEILIVLAAIGAVIDFVEATVKAITGEGSWTDAILAGVGAVLTVFGGKLIELAAKGAKGIVVVKGAQALRAEGKNVRTEMKVLQKAEYGTEAYMSQGAARSAVRELNQSFDTFQHGVSTVGKAFKEAFTSEAKAFIEQGAKKFFAGKLYDIKYGAVFGRDINQSLRIIKAYPELLKDPAVVKALGTATGLQVGKIGTEIVHGWNEATGADQERVEDGNLHSPVRVWTDRGFSSAKSVAPEPIAAVYDAIKAFTP